MTSQVGRAACTGLVLAALSLGTNGCGHPVTESRFKLPERSTMEVVRHDSAVEASASLSGSIIRVKVEQRVVCEMVTRTRFSDGSAPTEERTSADCGRKPVANAAVVLTIDGGTLNARTDVGGSATFDINEFMNHEQVVAARTGTVTTSGASPVVVNLTELQIFASWKAEGEAAVKAQVARTASEKNDADFSAASKECLAPTTSDVSPRNARSTGSIAAPGA